MTSRVGRSLGHYQVVEKIGEGGMGDVYRARDGVLGRDVALKFLSEDFIDDRERLYRFEKEARFLAAVNHPNIATLHGFENVDGTSFLVMELVSGETLADRIARGALSVQEAVPIFRQIAEALECAHEKGVVHRDLKPANVKVTAEGQVKVLDFGLAKALGSESAGTELSQSPTFARGRTQSGVILGTAAYLSPEQARGKPVDKRTDVWSFGCVLYEALTGRRAFDGETFSDTVARILTGEPDWNALPEGTPESIRAVLKRCLEKDALKRLRHVDPILLDFEDTSARLPARRRRAIRPLLLGTLGAVGAFVAAWNLRPSPVAAPSPPARLVLSLAPVERLAGPKPALAFSPDGARLAYAATARGVQRIYLRDLDELESVPITGTEGGEQPFFSPDGEWLGFFAGGKLKKISLSGGSAIALCDTSSPAGGSWGADHSIVFAPMDLSALSVVSADGGPCRGLTTLREREIGHHWPQLLPDGSSVIFTASDGFNRAIWIQSLKTGERQKLLDGASYAHYASGGYLVYDQEHSVLAAPFDSDKLEVTGPSQPIAVDLALLDDERSQYALSPLGWLVYLAGNVGRSKGSLVWVDRSGTAQSAFEAPGKILDCQVSPDDRRLVATIRSDQGFSIWSYDVPRDAWTRLTFERSSVPEWSRDGTQVFYTRHISESEPGLYRTRSDGSGSTEQLLSMGDASGIGVESVSPDSRFLAYNRTNAQTDGDVWILPLEGVKTPRPFVGTMADEGGARFSPDGRYLAYVSNASGRPEIYVETFPERGGKWQVSTEGGTEPVWARSGRELFYRSESQLMAIEVETAPSFRPSKPRVLFEDRYQKSGWFPAVYDVADDGRFLMIESDTRSDVSEPLSVILNWPQALKRSLR
jgi:serine/threonine-protein kinase